MKYWETSGGKNCPLGFVIVTEHNCREAASQLGLKYNRIFGNKYAPAGCWTYGFNGDDVYFNNITNPLSTEPYWNSHGICAAIGTEHSVLLHFVF